jgi:lysophospholipase L1-like esterase
MSSKVKKLSRSLLYVLLAVILLEGALQVAAFFVKEQAWRAKASWVTGGMRILALGDSNTYGLYLDKEEAYPAQLEKLWNETNPDKPIEIINVGYPGTNSFRLRANLPELIDTFQPDMALVLIGFNDFWTPVEDARDISGDQHAWYTRLKLYRLYYMVARKGVDAEGIDMGERQVAGKEPRLSPRDREYLLRESGVTSDQLDEILAGEKNTAGYKKVEAAFVKLLAEKQQDQPQEDVLNTVKYGNQIFSLGINEGEPARSGKNMEGNIKAVLDYLASEGISAVLMDYPTNSGYYLAANRKIKSFADEYSSESGRIQYLELSNVMPEQCRQKPEACPELLFYDAHATAEGNALVAKRIAGFLETLLD